MKQITLMLNRMALLAVILSIWATPLLADVVHSHKFMPSRPVAAAPMFSGSWYTPSLEGSGITLQVLGEGEDATILLHLMTFDEAGIPVWLVSQIRAGDARMGAPWMTGYQMDVNAVYGGNEVEAVGSVRLYFYTDSGLYVYAWIDEGIVDSVVADKLQAGINMMALTKFTN